MKIVAFADIHLSTRALKEVKKKIKKENPDLVICAGDFTVFNHEVGPFIKKMAALGKPLIIIHGNHEELKDVKREAAKYQHVQVLHKKVISYQGYFFIGFGGGGFQYNYPEFDNFISKCKDKIKGQKLVLITHAPPHGTNLDDVFGSHVGSKTFIKFIKKYKDHLCLYLCGHIHECMKNTSKVGKCLMANPGADGMVFRI